MFLARVPAQGSIATYDLTVLCLDDGEGVLYPVAIVVEL